MSNTRGVVGTGHPGHPPIRMRPVAIHIQGLVKDLLHGPILVLGQAGGRPNICPMLLYY